MAKTRTLALGFFLVAGLPGLPLQPVLAQTGYSVKGANAYVNAKDWNGLARYANAWTNAEPSNPTAWFYLGNNAVKLNQPDAAIAAFQRVVKLDPNHHNAWHSLGLRFMQVRRVDDAVAAFKRATEIEPTKPNYWKNLAAAYSEVGRIELALAALDTNMKLAAPHGDWTDWHNLGTAFRNLGGNRYLGRDSRDTNSRAATAFRKSVELNPKNGEGWNSLGAVYQTVGNYPEALRCYKKADALGNRYARKNHDDLMATIAAERAAIQNMESGGGSASASQCGSYSGPVAAACNANDAGAMGRYQDHQETQEDKRKYGVQ